MKHEVPLQSVTRYTSAIVSHTQAVAETISDTQRADAITH